MSTTWAVAAGCAVLSAIGLAMNLRYAAARRGRPHVRALKLLYSAIQIFASGAYWLYVLGVTPMPEGGKMLSLAVFALVAVITAGAIANDSR